jgi:hypothetical protein
MSGFLEHHENTTIKLITKFPPPPLISAEQLKTAVVHIVQIYIGLFCDNGIQTVLQPAPAATFQILQTYRLARPYCGSGFPLRRPVFDPGSSHVGSVVDRAALGQVFSEKSSFACHSFTPLIVPH